MNRVSVDYWRVGYYNEVTDWLAENFGSAYHNTWWGDYIQDEDCHFLYMNDVIYAWYSLRFQGDEHSISRQTKNN